MKVAGEETDALLNLLRGYARLWADPPTQQDATTEQTKARAAELFIQTFTALDALIRKGVPLPEEWDESLWFRQRARYWDGAYAFVYVPGTVGPAPCNTRPKVRGCRWLDPGAAQTACSRCHTIRIRVLP